MNRGARIIAEAPGAQRGGGVHWLASEFDPDSGGGLLDRRQLGEGLAFDSWHVTEAEAPSEARCHWGTQSGDWPAEDTGA